MKNQDFIAHIFRTQFLIHQAMFHYRLCQLDITNKDSLVKFKTIIETEHNGVIHSLINNAAMAYKRNAPDPFSRQAKVNEYLDLFCLAPPPQCFFCTPPPRQCWDFFRLCPAPILVGAYYLHPPEARVVFLHNELRCNGMCSVTGSA